MSDHGRWRWELRGKISLAALAGFQVVIFIVGKVDAAMRSRRISDAVASAEDPGDKALALVGGILGAAAGGYLIIWVWLMVTAVLAALALIFRPRRVRP